jgi:hypothetical protein
MQQRVQRERDPVRRPEAEEAAHGEGGDALPVQAQRDDVPADQEERDDGQPAQVEVCAGPLPVPREHRGQQVLQDHQAGRHTPDPVEEFDPPGPVGRTRLHGYARDSSATGSTPPVTLVTV